MRKRLATMAATALIGGAALLAMPVDAAHAAGGWTLHSTQVVGGKTFYRYTNSSGGVMITDQAVDSTSGNRWIKAQ